MPTLFAKKLSQDGSYELVKKAAPKKAAPKKAAPKKAAPPPASPQPPQKSE